MSQAHILVVDDEPDIRELVREILEDEGYRVTVAENGERARNAFIKNTPDLVLLDIWMPDVDGITLLREWSAGGVPECPVVVMSGHGNLETAVEATRLGRNRSHWRGCWRWSNRRWRAGRKLKSRQPRHSRQQANRSAAAPPCRFCATRRNRLRSMICPC